MLVLREKDVSNMQSIVEIEDAQHGTAFLFIFFCLGHFLLYFFYIIAIKNRKSYSQVKTRYISGVMFQFVSGWMMKTFYDDFGISCDLAAYHTRSNETLPINN